MTNPTEKKFVTVLITTQDHIIRGKLELPIPSVVEILQMKIYYFMFLTAEIYSYQFKIV